MAVLVTKRPARGAKLQDTAKRDVNP